MIKKSLLFILVLNIAPLIYAQGGVSTGEARTYTSRRTVGIVDPNAPKIFEDITAQTILKDYIQPSGDAKKRFILEATAGTVAVFDYDNDGKPDIYLCRGATINALQGKEKMPRSVLLHNLGNWQFEDVTDKAGVANERWGMGAAVGDYDNDGFPDLFVSNYGVSRLYHNNGDGTFTDVAEKLGIKLNGWFTGATFGDYDKDGRLDLFVPGYVEFDLDKKPINPEDVAAGKVTGRNFCQFRGEPQMCGPRGLPGVKDHLFHQKADGTFEDVSDKAGVTDEGRYYGFSSVFTDINNDGWLDLLVVNDSTPKQLYLNKHDGTFEETGYPAGIALNENGREQAGMGVAVGDYDNDGQIDFYITNFSDDYNTLYHNDGGGNFTDVTFQAGLGETTIPFLGWGTSFMDFDNDGWKDILVANGHIYPSVDQNQWGTSYAQQMLLFRNNKVNPKTNQIQFDRIGANPASALAKAIVARGLAISDLDGDGKLDAVVATLDGAPMVIRNVAETSNHWLTLKLIGDVSKKTPKDAIGSVVYVTTGQLRQRFDVTSGGSYASQSDQRIHIGLGNFNQIDKLEIHWAGGAVETVKIPAVDRILTIEEGKQVNK